MDYQIKYLSRENKEWGFTLVELIVVIGIALLFFSISTSSFNSFKAHSNLEIAMGGTVEAIRLAQSSAQSGKGDSKWGVKILTNKVIIFEGNTYNERDNYYDQFLTFSGGINASGLSEIVFEKVSGTTINTGTIILTNNGEIKNIAINAKGTITY